MHKSCCGPGTDNPPYWTWEDCSDYLRRTGTMERAQKEFSYWDSNTDTSNSWNGSGGTDGFQAFLAPFGADGKNHWKVFKQTCAHMVAWNCGQWGSEYTNMDVRGNSISYPGGSQGIWDYRDKAKPPEKWNTLAVHEWKQHHSWIQIPQNEPNNKGWYHKP